MIAPRQQQRPHVSIVENRWYLKGQVTYPGAQAEGLLMNVRLVNAVFENRNCFDFGTEANTDQFITKIPNYAAHGVRAFIQSGRPGCEGTVNFAFNPDSSLRENCLKRGCALLMRAINIVSSSFSVASISGKIKP